MPSRVFVYLSKWHRLQVSEVTIVKFLLSWKFLSGCSLDEKPKWQSAHLNLLCTEALRISSCISRDCLPPSWKDREKPYLWQPKQESPDSFTGFIEWEPWQSAHTTCFNMFTILRWIPFLNAWQFLQASEIERIKLLLSLNCFFGWSPAVKPWQAEHPTFLCADPKSA